MKYPQYRAAIFDLDGVIVDTTKYHYLAWRRLAKELGFDLRGLGWSEVSADGALASFHTLSMIFVIPIALWSDRLGVKKVYWELN